MAVSELGDGLAAVEPPRGRRGRAKSRPGSLARHLVLLAFVALALVPIYFMAANALKTDNEYAGNQLAPPHHPVLSTLHASLANGDLYRWMLNSVLITGAAVLVSTAVAAFGAYPIALMDWRPGRAMLSGLIALMVVPPIVLVIPLAEVRALALGRLGGALDRLCGRGTCGLGRKGGCEELVHSRILNHRSVPCPAFLRLISDPGVFGMR